MSSKVLNVSDDDDDNGEASSSSEIPPSIFPRISIETDALDVDAEIEQAAGDPTKIAFAKWKQANEKSTKPSKKVEIPSTSEMAAQLNIDWIGAIDPGTKNCAIAIVSAKECRLVYWRVFVVAELCKLCEDATGICMRQNVTMPYSFEASMHAVAWWCQQDSCPLKKCDLVVVERQSFSREMTEVQGTWMAAMAHHKPAVRVENCPLNEGTSSYTMIVPKTLVISSATVKGTFRGFFPNVMETTVPLPTPVEAASAAAAAEAAAGGSSSKPPAKKPRRNRVSGSFVPSRAVFGVGDAEGDAAQYAANKQNAKYWCRYMLGDKLDPTTGMRKGRKDSVFTEHGEDDFEKATIERHGTMTVAQVADTMERLGTAKADDLADAFFIVFYAADSIIPHIWRRAYGPTAKRHTTRYVYGDTPSSTATSAMTPTPDSRHQILFAYLLKRIHLQSKCVDEIRARL